MVRGRSHRVRQHLYEEAAHRRLNGRRAARLDQSGAQFEAGLPQKPSAELLLSMEDEAVSDGHCRFQQP